MKKAVIFDFDGTLADSIHSLKYCADYAMSMCGYEPIPLEKYFYFVGDGADTLIKRCLAYSGDVEGVDFEKAFMYYQMHLVKHCMYNVKPYEGMVETLAALKEAGLKIAVFSNKPHDRAVDCVEELFGKDYFDVIIGHSDARPKKPNPQGLYDLAEMFGIKTSDIAYVGDTSTDMQTGKNAGAYTIGVLWGFRDREELVKNKADVIIEKPTDILSLVL